MANSGEKLLYFVIGGFVGASIALLFAPKSGEETRRVIGDRYRAGTEEVGRRVQSGREYLSDVRQDLGQRVSSTVEKGRDVLNRQKEQITSAVEAGKKAYEEEKGKIGRSGEPEGAKG